MPNFRITQQHVGASEEADTKLFDAVWGVVDPTNASHDGRGIYSYIGEGGSSEKDIASIRTLLPLDHRKSDGISSFEVTLLDTGERNYIAIGVCNSTYNTHLLPGWEEVSIAFHTDEGSIFNSSDHAIPLNTPCKKGDIIKISIFTCRQDRTKVIVEFFLNGTIIYHLPTAVCEGGFHGVIGMMSQREKIKISKPVISKEVKFEEIWLVSTPHSITHIGRGLCSYSGVGDFQESSIGTIRAKSQLDPLGEADKRTLEVKIIDPGEAGYIAIGVVNDSYPPNLFPGWKDPSVGYHADNGNLFYGTEQPTNRPCRANDIMKCVVDPVDKSPKRVRITFYRNQAEVGQLSVWTPTGGFYFCVGMMSRSEKVLVVLPELTIPYRPPTQNLRFEDFWEELTPNLVHRGDGMYEYMGQGGQDFVGSLRTKQPMSPFDKHNWFEIKILSAGVSCYIALGVCSKLYSPTVPIGWDDLSVGFHADNGLILQSNLGEKATEHPCKAGDVVRCTIEPIDRADKQVKVLFSRNGIRAGSVTFWKPTSGFYGQISCMSVGESIKVLSSSMGLPSLSFLPQPSVRQPPFPQGEIPGGDHPHGPPGGVIRSHPHMPSGHSPHFSMSRGQHPQPLYHHSFYPHMIHPGHHFPPAQRTATWLHPSHGSHEAYMPTPHHPYPSQVMHRPSTEFHLPLVGTTKSDPYTSPSNEPATVSSMEGPGFYSRVPTPTSHLPSQPMRQTSVQEPRVTSHVEPLRRMMTTPPDSQRHCEGLFSAIPVDYQTATSSASSHYDYRTSPPRPPLDGPRTKFTRGNPDKDLVEKLHIQPEPTRIADETSEYPDSGLVQKTPQSSAKASTAGLPLTNIQNSQKAEMVPETAASCIQEPEFVSSVSSPEISSANLPSTLAQSSENVIFSEAVVSSVQEPKVFSSAPSPDVITNRQESKPSTGRRPLISQVSVSSTVRVTELTKAQNKNFKILHQVTPQDGDGPFESSVPEDEILENAFVVSRLPLSEKNPYFEVEIQHIGPNGNVAVGLIWDNYPVFHLPGGLEGSIAFQCLTGSVLSGGTVFEPSTPVTCSPGDIIGCRAILNYKSEISDKTRNSVEIEFYFNCQLLSTTSLCLPPSGFFPAIGLKGYKSKVKYSQNLQLSPETYFESHPLPKGYRNFISPPKLASGWQCLKNATIKSGNTLYLTKQSPGSPTVIQNLAPLTIGSPYFEVELKFRMSNYSVLSVGGTPKTVTDLKRVIPGETQGSVGYYPLLGFIMRSTSICSTIPDKVSNGVYSKVIKVGVGINFQPVAANFDTSFTKGDKPDTPIDGTSPKRVSVFFTINSQQVGCVLTSLPSDGLYPCLAIDSDAIQLSECVATVNFPAQWPPLVTTLPLGFVRGFEDYELKHYDSNAFVDHRPANVDMSTLSARAIQAALPISPSRPYYEICVINGGETFKISCGLAPFDYSLNTHPGLVKESVALHADDGKLFHNGSSKAVVPPLHYRGTIIGCGLRFPDEGKPRHAEVFFTVNRKLVCSKLVKVPQLGYYPTVGMRTKCAVVSIDLCAPIPPCEVNRPFRTGWGEIQNMNVEGNILQLASQLEPGKIIRATPVTIEDSPYFSITPLTEREGSLLIGFTSNYSSLRFLQCSMEGVKAFAADIPTGVILIYDNYFQIKDSFGPVHGTEFGCGLLRESSMKKLFFFFTVNGQAVSFVALDEIDEKVYPFIIISESSTQILVDMCAVWPNYSPVGHGWARYANIKLVEDRLTHSAPPGKKKFPVGFLQSSTPLTQFSPYFDIEICSRANDKGLAIGLASRQYPHNSWVGWSSESISYHLDDGKLFKSSKCGQNFGPKGFAGDTVGCGIRFGTRGITPKEEEKVEVFFTFNGSIVGTSKIPVPSGGLFPTVCIESPSESVIFSRHSQFPPISSMVCDSEWSNAYCIVQSGLFLQYSLRGAVTATGFCQARAPFSTSKNYFEVLITGCKEQSSIQIGLSTLISPGTTSHVTYGALYNIAGQIITRRASSSRSGAQKYTTHSQRAGFGDRIGCMVDFNKDAPCSVEFYLNQMKVVSMNITDFWRPQNVYPTVVLTTPEDSVLPFLNISKPAWNPLSLIGWLRSERVKLRGAIIEYTAGGKSDIDVGVAQISQALQVSKDTYLEIEILDPGERGTIAIGLAPADYPLGRHPGWDKHSIGYHGDDGRLFQVSGTGCAFGPSWKKNDVIGLGVRSSAYNASTVSEVQVYFTKNGEELGHATHKVPSSGLFPTIGLHSPREKVKVRVNGTDDIPCNFEPKRNFWRTLCGIHVTPTKDDATQILTFRKNGREASKLYVMTSLAVAATPFSSDMQYFEVELLGVGSIGIAVGVTPSNFPMDQATGWIEDSVGYHTDDGCLYAGSVKGTVFGPVPHKGDVIGCGLAFSPNNTKHCSVFFTYNGTEIGRVRSNYVDGGLFPSITLTSSTDKVSVQLMETFKPQHPQTLDLFVGLMRIQNCSYSDQLVRFSGAGSSGYTNAPAMAQFAVPMHRNRNYFSANLVKRSDTVLIGLAAKDYPMRYAPGVTSVSVAYDVKVGNVKAVYGSDDHYSLKVPVCDRGDTIGCGIDYSLAKEEGEYVFFTRNGILVCRVRLRELIEDLFPVVGFVSQNKNSVVFMDWSTPVFKPLNILSP